MNNIADHVWSDGDINTGPTFGNEISLEVNNGEDNQTSLIYFNKNDATVIAKYFHSLMTADERVDFWNTLFENPLIKEIGYIPQSETTYIAMSDKTNLTPKQLKSAVKSTGSPGIVFVKQEHPYNSKIGEIKTNELFNREDDLHE